MEEPQRGRIVWFNIRRKDKDLREREIQQMFLYKICQSLYALELNLFISNKKANFIPHSVSFSVLCISDLE